LKKILFIDNLDSFSYNLIDYFERLSLEVQVIEYPDLEIYTIAPQDFDALVISPGPGKPSDYPKLFELIQQFEFLKPILGICLGHQILASYYGNTVQKAAKPQHGITSIINHHSAVFDGIPQGTEVMRYHSLLVTELNAPLKSIAWTNEKEIMAFEHTDLPIIGLQFHPESVLSPDGFKLLQNWSKQV
jgi:para-aminobenzoate synthetase component II